MCLASCLFCEIDVKNLAEHNVFVAAESLDKVAAERDELTKKLKAFKKESL